jgi:hypothetical protein
MSGAPKLKQCFQLGIHGEQRLDETSGKPAARPHPIHSPGTPVTGASRRAHTTLVVLLLAEARVMEDDRQEQERGFFPA